MSDLLSFIYFQFKSVSVAVLPKTEEATDPANELTEMPKKGRKRNRSRPVAPPSISQMRVVNNGISSQQLTFQCQLAHGSPTTFIGGFENVTKLYEKIADAYDLNKDDILYCTVNSYKLNMDNLLSGHIGINDFIFAHIKGQKKEIDVLKTDSVMGVTVSDNGCGKVYIKRIKAGTMTHKLTPALRPGDHIEKLNDVLMVGKRHHEVSAALRAIPVGQTFKLRLIEPFQTGFSFLASRSATQKPNILGSDSGSQTVRFKSQGGALIQDAPDKIILDRITKATEEYLGISDQDLALSLWELGKDITSTVGYAEAIAESEFAAFEFPENLIFDIWGVISDWKDGRLKVQNEE